MFCTSTTAPSVLVIDRSAIGPSVLVSVAVLFVVFGSVAPAGAATVAVLTREPEPVGEIDATSVNVTLPPTGTVTTALIDPDPEAGHVAPELGVQVQVAPVNKAGRVSVTVAPAAVDGPAFVTMIVYVIDPPGTDEPDPSVFVIARSGVTWTVSVSMAVLLVAVGSVTPLGAVMVAVFASVPVAEALTVAVSRSLWVEPCPNSGWAFLCPSFLSAEPLDRRRLLSSAIQPRR